MDKGIVINTLVPATKYRLLDGRAFLYEKENGHRRLRRGKLTLNDGEVLTYEGYDDIPESTYPHAYRWMFGDVRSHTFSRENGEKFEITGKDLEELPLEIYV